MNKKIIIILLLVAILLTTPADALLSPDQYQSGQCELVAKDYQRVYGGYLIFIQPLKDNGAYDLGPYNGHMINKAYTKERGIYYIDYVSQSYFKNESEVLDWYGGHAIIFNMNEGGTPFPFIWHY